jgi:hypothetical protein
MRGSSPQRVNRAATVVRFPEWELADGFSGAALM